jgi:hypothetical protein
MLFWAGGAGTVESEMCFRMVRVRKGECGTGNGWTRYVSCYRWSAVVLVRVSAAGSVGLLLSLLSAG